MWTTFLDGNSYGNGARRQVGLSAEGDLTKIENAGALDIQLLKAYAAKRGYCWVGSLDLLGDGPIKGRYRNEPTGRVSLCSFKMDEKQRLDLMEWGVLGVPPRCLKPVATGRLRVIRKQDGGKRLIFDGREGNKLLRGM